MLDIKFIREHYDRVRQGTEAKGLTVNLGSLLGLDEKRRALLQEGEALKAKRNQVSAEIGKLKRDGKDAASAIAEMDQVKDRSQSIDRVLETITSSLTFIANLADACPSITFGTGVLPLANYHPAMEAAQVAMVHHLVQGRLVLGVGPGVPGDAEAIGDSGSHRNRKTREALDHMRRIWSEEPPYRIDGEFYRTTTERSLDRRLGVGVALRPLQRPHPPIAITSIRPDSRGPHTAGTSGWTGISATYVGAYVVRAHIQSYLEGRRSAGVRVPLL